MADIDAVRSRLGEGLAIPACPLALNAQRKLDERRQRALFRYYFAAGAGGLAVGVHTTQFAIRDPKFGLFRRVLLLAAEERVRCIERGESPRAPLLIGGICGDTKQASSEAATLRELGYDAGLLSLAALRSASDSELLTHCRAVADIIPVFGFYLQPAAGGRLLSYDFWRGLTEIQSVVAIKIAAFNRYQTIDVVRAIAESGRDDIALYTGNDDNIIMDLLTPYRFPLPQGEGQGEGVEEVRIVGGLLGQWAVWTQRAVEIHSECRALAKSGKPIPPEMLRLNVHLTDANAAIFDAANAFAGCVPGIHEVLRRQGLLEGTWCLDPNEVLSPDQAAEIERVCRAYPHLIDDDLVAKHRDEWLS
jgi:dihydrodipicolinate synthase/N-acetylneuraminate lyase